MSRLTGWFGRGNTRALFLSAGILALFVTPLAIAQSDGAGGATGQAAAGEGEPIEGGVRNPSPNQAEELTRETEIIAQTDTYGTRQSNKSDNGGGAIYGCRSAAGGTPANNEPCIRANNLSNGLAFEFESDGGLVGTIVSSAGANARPFTTNATQVATGLNADRVDNLDAAQIVAQSRQTEGLTAANAQALGGQPPSTYATRWALINEDGEIARQTGGFETVNCYEDNANCYIDANEDVRDNGVHAQIITANDPNSGDDTTLSGETSASPCGFAFVDCGPEGTEDPEVLVVTPRNSDGSAPVDGDRYFFYVYVTGTAGAETGG